MNNQTFALNASAFYAGAKALQTGTKVFFGSNSLKDRSNLWNSISKEKGYFTAFCKTIQVLIGQDSLFSRISNCAQCFIFASGAYLLANLSQETSKAKETVAKINNEISLVHDNPSDIDAYIESAYSKNLLSNINQLFEDVKNLSGLYTSAKSLRFICETNAQNNKEKYKDFDNQIKSLEELAKCSSQNEIINLKNTELAQAQTDFQTESTAKTELEKLVANLQKQLSEANSQSINAENSLQAAISSALNEASSTSNQAVATESSLNTLVSTLQEQLSSMVTQLAQEKSNLLTQSYATGDLSNVIATLESQISSLQKQLSSVISQSAQAESSLQAIITNAQNEASSRSNQAVATESSLKSQVASLEEQLSSAISQSAQAESSLQAATASALSEASSTSNQAIRTEISLNTLVSSLQKQLSSAISQSAQAESSLQAAIASAQNEASSTSNQALTTESSLKSQVANLEEQLSSAISQSAQAESSLLTTASSSQSEVSSQINVNEESLKKN